MAEKDQTIIIKKIKKGGHGHHGGAWKVAYADFVTAMMAFFLLLWLLTSTPVENLQGLADYFSPTMGLQGKLGIGFKGGRSPNTEGYSNGDWASKGLVFGAPPSGPIIRLPDNNEKDLQDNPKVSFVSVGEEGLKSGIERVLKQYQNIETQISPQGIKLTLYESEDKTLFERRTAKPTTSLHEIIDSAADLIKTMPHYITISVHTGRDAPADRKEQHDTLWNLSVKRALAVRRLLTQSGMDREQIAAITGYADHSLVEPKDPQSLKNSRIVLVLLTASRAGLDKQSAPESVLFQ